MATDSPVPPSDDPPPDEPRPAGATSGRGDPPWDALAAVLTHRAAPADDAAVARWLAEDPAHAAELQRLTTLWRHATRGSDVDVDAAWSRVAPRLAQVGDAASRDAGAAHAARHLRLLATSPEQAHHDTRRGAPRRATAPATAARRRRWLVVGGAGGALAAAAAALLLVVGAPGRRDPAALAAADSVARWGEARTYTTARGQRARVQLADGSVVHLAPLSRITVAVDAAGGAARDVRLSGAAVFDVATDSLRPFRVHAAGAVTRVLGTSFGVRAYEEDASLEVVVRSGRVAVRPESGAAQDTGVVLTPGARARRAVAADAPIRVDSVDAVRALAWSEGRLVFARTPLREVARELERWRDVQITIADSALGDRRVTVDLTDSSLDHAVRTLGILLDLPVRQEVAGTVRRVHIGPPTDAASAAGDRP